MKKLLASTSALALALYSPAFSAPTSPSSIEVDRSSPPAIPAPHVGQHHGACYLHGLFAAGDP